MNARIADLVALREHRRRDRRLYVKALAVSRPVSESGSGSPMWMSCSAAGRTNLDRRIRRAAAELVFAVGADAEDRGVAIRAPFSTPFNSVLAAHPREVLAHLEQIAVRSPTPNRLRLLKAHKDCRQSSAPGPYGSLSESSAWCA